MKLHSAKVLNFGSFRELNVNFHNKSMILIYGQTGSGKSTLMDIPLWTLFGITSKNGLVDDIRNWAHLDEVTEVQLCLQIGEDILNVTRKRGNNQNDLYWEENEKFIRGKDVSETQKLLTERLGFDADTYLASAHFSEFSPVSSFFLGKSRQKRELMEKIANLNFPIRLSEKITLLKKQLKPSFSKLELQFASTEGKLKQLQSSKDSSLEDLQEWDKKHLHTLKLIKIKAQNFDLEKEAKLLNLQDKFTIWNAQKQKKIDLIQSKLNNLKLTNLTCEYCGSEKPSQEMYISKKQELESELNNIQIDSNPYIDQLNEIKILQNYYFEQYITEETRQNPFKSQIVKITDQLETLQISYDQIKLEKDQLQRKFLGLDILYKLSFELRGHILQTSIKMIENLTNNYLSTYFDAAIKLRLSLPDSDNLQVQLDINGYSCVYTQLSKGQRQILKLCFAVAIMQVAANQLNTSFQDLFFDESMDGMDSDTKARCFNLFQSINTNNKSIFIIDHEPTFQSLFTDKILVTIETNTSTIVEE